MKIASLVPSWTETLIDCGADVVARTRFCIHPRESVSKIPAVGGTKDINWDKLRATGAEILILDREENRKEMASEAPIPYFDSHVRSIDDVIRDLRGLAEALGREPQVAHRLEALASRWESALLKARETKVTRAWADLPGLIEWVKPPRNSDVVPPSDYQLVYMIWRDPWMAAGPGTFIGSMLRELGFGSIHKHSLEPYPKLELETLDPDRTVLLLSSEPYPFHKKKRELESLPFAMALVDGESYSWFGLRSLEFFERFV